MYAEDSAGNITQVNDDNWPENAGFTLTYGYDRANRLTYEGRIGYGSLAGPYDYTVNWTLDGNGNLSAYQLNGGPLTSYNLGNNDQLLSGGGYVLGYNNSNGNPTRIQTPSGVGLTLGYDYENQLTSLTYSNGATANSFSYNGDGQRVQKVDSWGTTRYVYEGATVLGEVNASGSFLVFYGPGLGRTDVVGGSLVTNYTHQDALGSTTAVTDASGNRTGWYWYQAFGSSTTYRQQYWTPFKFAGKSGYYADFDSGMELLGRRYYLPDLHRFLTQDPMGHAAGLNLYEYASNNPLSNVDPTGLSTDDLHGLADLVSDAASWLYRRVLTPVGHFIDRGATAHGMLGGPAILSQSLPPPPSDATGQGDPEEHPQLGLRAFSNTLGSQGEESAESALQDILSKGVLSQSRVIARGNRIREVGDLVREYGGRAKDWVKKSSPVMMHNGRPMEIHWYERHGLGRVRIKQVFK